MQSVINIRFLLPSHHIPAFPTGINLIYRPLPRSLDEIKFIISAYRAFNYFHSLYHRHFLFFAIFSDFNNAIFCICDISEKCLVLTIQHYVVYPRFT